MMDIYNLKGSLFCFILICGIKRVYPGVELFLQSQQCQQKLEERARNDLDEMLKDERLVSEYVSLSMKEMTVNFSKIHLETETQQLEADLNKTLKEIIKEVFDENKDYVEYILQKDSEYSQNFESSIKNVTDSRIKIIENEAKLLSESMQRNLTKAREIATLNLADTDNEHAPVAFTALLTKNTNPSDRHIVFDREITNIRSGYNTSSGLFTAPVRGTYFFSSCFLVRDGYVNMQLLKNGIEVSRGYGVQGNSEGTGLIHTMLELTQGDYVGLKMIRDATTGFIRGDLYSSFAGFLVGS